MTRKTIHLSEKTEQSIINRTGHSGNYSGFINSSLNQLNYLLEQAKPVLTNDEWAEIHNVYAGSDLTKIAMPVNLAAGLLTHHGATLPKQLPETTQSLVNKLADMSQLEQLAVLDAVRLFWTNES